jgi:hypothetical protein
MSTGHDDPHTTPAEREWMLEIIAAEKRGERAPLLIGPFAAFSAIGLLQLATRHPDLGDAVKTSAYELIHALAKLFDGTPGQDLITRGFDPGEDVPRG